MMRGEVLDEIMVTRCIDCCRSGLPGQADSRVIL